MILELEELDTEHIAEALEWVFFVVLPNFCFGRALQDLIVKHQYSTICSQIDEYIDRTMFCELMRRINRPNPCCPGESQRVISQSRI